LISTLYTRRTGTDPESEILFRRLKNEGFDQLTGLSIEKVYRLEGITPEKALALKTLFCHPDAESIHPVSDLDPSEGPIIEVGYQRAVTDPEFPSILRGARSLGVGDLVWARLAHRYQFQGIDNASAEEIVKRYLYNAQVQMIIPDQMKWDSLRPKGETGPVELIELENMDREALLHLSEARRLFLNADQMKALQKISKSMHRPLTDAEVEMFAQTWSDHCFHTTWKSLGLLQSLMDATRGIDHPLVLSSFEDNAGVMNFYDGMALTLKGETHNSPSAVSPYGGIMTKHGGVIRDTLGCGQGAWPIGGSTIMGLGNPRMDWQSVPRGVLHPKTILLESIRGTADYCNPMGIPMMFPVYRFHDGYTGKCFALGHSIGILPTERATKGHPLSGDFAVLIGGPTGRDGLHGATVSSGSMTEKTSIVDASHVQIGHPIEERKFMEAIPVLRDKDCLRAVTDLGAAGLSSAAGEMGSETGIWINLDRVPLKTEGMHPWEIWISESQERMLLCVPPDKIEEALSILGRFEVTSSIVGKFTNTGRCQVIHDGSAAGDPENLPVPPKLTGETAVDLDFKDLRKECPLPKIEIKKPTTRQNDIQLPPLRNNEQWISAIRAVLGHLNICDQSDAGAQFDNTIQGTVITGPYGGWNGRMPNDIWVSAPVRGKLFGAGTATAFNPFYGEVDPAGDAKLMIIEAVSKLVAAGFHSEDIVLCDNFYTPKISPEVAWSLREMVFACADLSRKLKIPFISGKDSSSGTFIDENGNRLDVPPTLCVLALGRMPDIRKLVPKPWKKSGSRLCLIGPASSELGGSIYLDTMNQRGIRLPDPSIDAIQNLWNYIRTAQESGWILSASALGEGGLIRRLFEMALGSGWGCRIDLSDLSQSLDLKQPEVGLFAEMVGSILVEVDEKKEKEMIEKFNAIPIGTIVKDPNIILDTGKGTVYLPMNELIKVWESPFREVAR
jgi:phosphoribosylformylglycinamidine synthase II